MIGNSLTGKFFAPKQLQEYSKKRCSTFTIDFRLPQGLCYAEFSPSSESDSLSLNFAVPGNWLK
jgi:hypothetical protein